MCECASEMRRSPRPSGRAAHPDRAVLAASFAEDVVLGLQCCGDATNSQQPTAGLPPSGTETRSPKAAPRSNPPIPKPRSGMGV